MPTLDWHCKQLDRSILTHQPSDGWTSRIDDRI
jgi:hypothetical protein